MHGRNVLAQSVLNFYWIPLNFQTSALLTIAVPAAILRFPRVDHVAQLALLASVVAIISMVVPPVAGEISDRLRRSGSSRSGTIVGGAILNAAALLWMIKAPTPELFGIAVIVATLGQNMSQAAYSALIPEAVAREDWGSASGFQGVGTLIGSIAGLVVAGIGNVDTTLFVAAVLIVAGSLSVVGVKDRTFVESEHAHVSDWANFSIAFASRFFTIFGLTLLNTFILYFFTDVLKFQNASMGTALAGATAMAGAIVSSIGMGILSDRIPRKAVVAMAGVPMALAAIGFALVPQVRWILVFAVFFGLGLGAIVSTGWALALDSVPTIGNVARYLGIWGIASNLPAVIAPQAGKWILGAYPSPLEGYRALFIASGLSFLIGSAIVLWTGRRR